MPPNIKETIMKVAMLYQPLPPAAANRSFILLTFGGKYDVHAVYWQQYSTLGLFTFYMTANLYS